MGHDHKCLELAAHFLSDYAASTYDDHVRLADEIQRRVENWIEDWQEDATSPSEPAARPPDGAEA